MLQPEYDYNSSHMTIIMASMPTLGKNTSKNLLFRILRVYVALAFGV